MKSKPKISYIHAQMTIILEYLNSGELSLINLLYKFPRTSFLVSNFLNFEVEERLLWFLDSSFKLLPIFNASGWSIYVQIVITLSIPPALWVSCDINDLWVFGPYILGYTYKIVDNTIEAWGVNNITCVNFFKEIKKVLDELLFFITILDNGSLSSIDMFFR